MISLFVGFLKLLLRINDDMDTMETKKEQSQPDILSALLTELHKQTTS